MRNAKRKEDNRSDLDINFLFFLLRNKALIPMEDKTFKRRQQGDNSSDDASSSHGNDDTKLQSSSRSASPPSIRSRPMRVSATQAREYIEDEDVPFDAVHTENLTRWKEDDICGFKLIFFNIFQF
jgi:hypothetical protein